MGSAEIQVAGRYEKYSDFGHTTKPKYALKFSLPENKIANVILRGSYSESFQAPALGLLYSSQTTGFTASVVQDPLRPQDPPQQLRIITGGNPNLLPETAKTTYGGIVVEVPAVKDLSFSFDIFKFRINQVIVTPSSTYLLTANGIAQFPNGIVRDNTVGNPGPILYLQSVPQNNPQAYQLYRGFDIGVNYKLRNTSVGDFNFSAEATRIQEIGSDSGLGGGYFNNIGLYNNPKWRGNAGVGWKYKEFGANANVDVIGQYFNDGYTAAGWGENPFALTSVSASYRGFFGGTTLTVGANNVLDKQPPPNGRDTAGFDQNTYGAAALGRFVYVRIRKDF
jgi:iron complex outermembrane receptor protein